MKQIRKDAQTGITKHGIIKLCKKCFQFTAEPNHRFEANVRVSNNGHVYVELLGPEDVKVPDEIVREYLLIVGKKK